MKQSSLFFTILLGLTLLGAQPTVAQTSILNSKHDLSSGSTSGGPKSTSTTEVCVFCHTPHSQSSTTVLWNRTASAATYTVYSSPSMEQTVPVPGSASKNCLGCHDGTVAFNSLLNNPGSGVGTAPTMSANAMTGWDSLGTNLSNDHPVGLVYATSQATDGYLRAASLVGTKVGVTNGTITLPLVGTTTANATLECTSCHDPHGAGAGTSIFLRKPNTGSQICFVCHNK